jgi:hypothetical protein
MHKLLEIYVDEKNITASVSGDFNNQSSSKYFSFFEPTRNASISFSFYNINQVYGPRAKLTCASPKLTSPWNFVMDDSFRSIKSTNAIFSSTPNWRFNNLSDAFALNPKYICNWNVDVCGNTTVCMDRGVEPVRKYFAMYKLIPI